MTDAAHDRAVDGLGDPTPADASAPAKTPVPWHLLPDYDRDAPAVRGVDGRWVVAGRHAAYVLAGRSIAAAGMWYQVQYGRFNADTGQFLLVWVDPDQPPITLQIADEPVTRFMEAFTNRVNQAIVSSKQARMQSGATITATARRRADGQIFTSVLLQGAAGPADELAAEKLDAELRAELGM